MRFDQARGSGDGGAILLAAANGRYGDGLIEALAECVKDERQEDKVEQTVLG
jgi:hypothetical protein